MIGILFIALVITFVIFMFWRIGCDDKVGDEMGRIDREMKLDEESKIAVAKAMDL